MALLIESSVCLSVMPDTGEQRSVAPRMSATGLTSEAQLRYLLQWFGEFSELQRDDFLPVLAAARGDQPDQLAAMLANISCDNKPVSLFQCRIKLFNEWYPTWAEEEQDRLVKGVSEIDPDFGAKLQDLIINGPAVNGVQNGIDELHFSTDEAATESENIWNNDEQDVPAIDESSDQGVTDNIPVEIAATS